MKKNLFLTFALLLASLVGVNAQDWSMTLTADQGLPGFRANKGEGVENLKTYKSSVIRPGKAIDGFRFTVIETEYAAEKADGVQFFYLGEFSVYDLNGNKLNYTVTSNACHNTITGGTDGGGLAALNDGNYTTYFHSVWQGGHNVTENHYLEFTLEAPISEFVVEWNARSGKQYMPTVVGLTEKGVAYTPYKEYTYAVGDRLTTLEAVKSAAYVTILGHSPEKYTVYNRETGQPATEKVDGVDVPQVDLDGYGDMYFGTHEKKDSVASIAFAAQLIPTEDGDGSVYVYFPNMRRYVNGDATDNQLNEALNGYQYGTGMIEKAAKVFLTPVGDGDFTMHYTTEKDGAKYTVYIAADPRGNYKIFTEDRKAALEAKGWCDGFSIKCGFNFSFFNTEYEAPTWGGELLLGYTYHYAKSLYDLLGTEINEDESLNVEALAGIEAAMPDAWNTVIANKGLKDEEYRSQVKDLQNAIGRFVEAKVNTAYVTVADEMKEYANKLSATPKKDCYPEEAYNEFIRTNIITNGENLWNRGELENPYDYLNELLTYLNSIDTNIESFLASKYIINTLPAFFGERVEGIKGTPLGSVVEGRYEWTTPVNLDKAVNGFRLTFLAHNSGQSMDDYPYIALSELEVVDAEGNKLALDETLVTTNSVADNDGSGIPALFDGDKTTYYHSFWGSGTYDPRTYVYLDVKFPEGVNLANFTLKTVSRNQVQVPAYVVMTNYAEGFDPKLNMPNDYNVVLGNKVTDPAQLKDGGLYVISGNLRVNKEENPSAPRYYSGITPYHYSEVAAANDACVYMLKKVGDGWNIVSLANAQYWTEEAGLTSIQKDAAVIKVAKSTNIEGAVVLYSDMEPETLEAGYTLKASDGETDSIVVETAEIELTKRVYMDWDGGLAQRPCQSVLPGVFEYGYDVLKDYPNLINESAFGDYVHFNKTNGEGEWNIYEVTMDDPYYRWLLAALPKLNDLGLVPGIDPGCVVTTPEVEAAFNSAKAAAEAAVEAEERTNAETLVNDLVAAVNSLAGLEVVKIKNKGYYRIESAVAAFAQNFNGVTKSMYVDENTMKLMWGATPAELSWKTSEYFFQFIFLDEEAQIEFDVFPEGADAPYSYVIYNDKTQSYISEYNEDSRVCVSKTPVVYIVKPFAANEFMIHKSGDVDSKLHANQHGGGTGSGSDIVYWGSGSGTASAWYLRTVDEKATSISDLVVEGDEVVSVSYFTPAGAATATPVKGINIVVIVYNNGVVETKKVLVK